MLINISVRRLSVLTFKHIVILAICFKNYLFTPFSFSFYLMVYLIQYFDYMSHNLGNRQNSLVDYYRDSHLLIWQLSLIVRLLVTYLRVRHWVLMGQVTHDIPYFLAYHTFLVNIILDILLKY